MEIREALRIQAPSLALQRAAADEIARLDGEIQRMSGITALEMINDGLIEENERLSGRVATLERLINIVAAHFADGEPHLPPQPETAE